MRKRIFEIIEVATEDDKVSQAYDLMMMAVIIISLFPLCFKKQTPVLITIDHITVTIFIIDYVLRLCIADFKLGEGTISFIKYPFTPMAIIDLLSILPSLTAFSHAMKVLKIFRLLRTFRVFRAFKAFRYSKNITILINVFIKQKDSLLVVCWLAVGYVVVVALIMFNAEPETFDSFFDAIYWATVSLTTVGYGDIYAISSLGKIITMISAVLGIAIVALPSGIITAGYLDELQSHKKDKEARHNEDRCTETQYKKKSQGPDNRQTEEES